MSEFATVKEAAQHEELLLHRGLVLLGGLLAGAGLAGRLLAAFSFPLPDLDGVVGSYSLGQLAPYGGVKALIILLAAIAGVAAGQGLWLLLGWLQKALTQVPLAVLLKRAAVPFAVFLAEAGYLSAGFPSLLGEAMVFAGLVVGFLLLALLERRDKRKLYFAFPTENEYYPLSLFTHGSVIILGTGVGWFLQSLPNGPFPSGLWFALAVGLGVWIISLLLAALAGLFYPKLTFDQVYLAVALACLPLAFLPLQTTGWIQYLEQGKAVGEQKAEWLPFLLAGLSAGAFLVTAGLSLVFLGKKSIEQTPAWEELFRALMLIAAVPFLLYAAAYWPAGAAFGQGHLVGKLDLFREGESLAAGQAFLLDRLPFKEIFLRHGFLTDVISGVTAMQWFGRTVLSARLLSALLLPLGLVAVYLLGIFCLPWLWAVILALVLVTGHLGAIPETQFFFTLIGFIFTLYSIQSGRWLMLLVSGLATVLALVSSYSAGLMALAGHGCLLAGYAVLGQEKLKQRLLSLAVYAGTLLAGLLFWFLYLGVTGSLSAYFENFGWVLSNVAAVFGVAPGAWAGAGLGAILFWALPPVVLVLGCLYFASSFKEARENGAIPWNLLLLIPVAALFWLRFLERSDEGMLREALPVTAMLAAFFIYHVTSRHRRMRGMIFLALLPCLLVPQAGRLSLVQLAGGFGDKNRIAVDGLVKAQAKPLENLYLPEEQAHELGQVIDYLDDQVGSAETYYDFSNQPLLYFLVPRRPAVPALATALTATFTQQLQAIQGLSHAPVKAVVWSGRLAQTGLNGVPSEVRQYALSEYLLRKFTPVTHFANTVILTPAVKDMPPEAEAAAAMQQAVSLEQLPVFWGLQSKYDPGQGGTVAKLTVTAPAAIPAAAATVGNTPAAQAAATKSPVPVFTLALPAPLTRRANTLVLEVKAPVILNRTQAKLSWGNPEQGRSLTFTLTGDNQPHRYAFRMASLASWVLAGNVDKYSLEFTQSGADVKTADLLLVRDIPELEETTATAAPAAVPQEKTVPKK